MNTLLTFGNAFLNEIHFCLISIQWDDIHFHKLLTLASSNRLTLALTFSANVDVFSIIECTLLPSSLATFKLASERPMLFICRSILLWRLNSSSKRALAEFFWNWRKHYNEKCPNLLVLKPFSKYLHLSFLFCHISHWFRHPKTGLHARKEIQLNSSCCIYFNFIPIYLQMTKLFRKQKTLTAKLTRITIAQNDSIQSKRWSVKSKPKTYLTTQHNTTYVFVKRM